VQILVRSLARCLELSQDKNKNMAVDTTLIEGAYAASAPRGVPGSKLATSIGKTISDASTSFIDSASAKVKQKKEEQKQGEKEFQAQLDAAAKASGLSDAEYDEFVKRLGPDGELKNAFLNPDATPAEQSKILRRISRMAETTREYEDVITDVGENAQIDGNISNSFKNDPFGKALIGVITDPNATLEVDPEDPNGEMGFTVDGKFMPFSEVQKTLEDGRVDDTFKEGFRAINDAVIQDSAKNTDVKYSKWNPDLVKNKVDDLINTSTNLKSLATDPMLGGAKSFKDHLYDDLVGKPYSELIGGDYDLDDDNNGIIDEDEAKNIMNNLLSDGKEEFLKEELSNYFTNTVIREKGWDVGEKSQMTDNTPTKLENQKLRVQLRQNWFRRPNRGIDPMTGKTYVLDPIRDKEEYEKAYREGVKEGMW